MNSTSQSSVSKEGWLYILENIHKDFQKRWFVLKDDTLCYYERYDDNIKKPIGTIIMEEFDIDLVKNDKLFCFIIKFVNPNNGSYTLGAISQELMEQWMKSLKRASFIYTKSVIKADLEKSLTKLKGMKIETSHLLVPIDPAQKIKSLSSENLPLSSNNSFNMFNFIFHGKKRGNTPSTTYFDRLHIKFGKRIIKDRLERLRSSKNKNKLLFYINDK